MKLFQVIQNQMAIAGIRPSQRTTFNRQNLIVLLLIGLSVISMTEFLLFDANTFQQYAKSFFAWISVFATFVGFYLIIVKSTDFYKYIEHLERIIEKRT